MVSGGTDTHLLLLDVFSKGVRGKEAEKALDRARITVNKNAIPFDTNPPLNPSGIRLGSPAVTTRGFREPEMRETGELIAEVLHNIASEDAIADVRRRVEALTARFPLYQWKLAPGQAYALVQARCIIAIDARRIRDFGIGTYIRSLVHALGAIDTDNRYTSSGARAMCARWPDCRKIFTLPSTRARISSAFDHVAFPLFLHHLAPDLVHIPLNRVPLFMMRPYVVTVHDMSSLLFDEPSGAPHAIAPLPVPPWPGARAPRDCRFRRHPPRRGESDGHPAQPHSPGL